MDQLDIFTEKIDASDSCKEVIQIMQLILMQNL